MKNLLTIFIVLACATIFTSCRHYRYYPNVSGYHPKVKARRVIVLQKPMPDTAQALGQVLCRVNREHKAYKKARKLAGKHGANAIYLEQGKEISSGQRVANALAFTSFKGRYKFLAYHR